VLFAHFAHAFRNESRTSFLTTPVLLLLLPALQGAFNIAYVGVAWLTKQPRPYHLCTPHVQRAWEKLAGEKMQEWACI